MLPINIVFELLAADLVAITKLLDGPPDCDRNVKCWDEALDAAKKHKDVFLEAKVCKAMGSVARQYG